MQAANARYGRIVIRFYVAFHGLLLTVVCVGVWFLAARSNSNGIPPNTSLGFRTQHTLASAQGWYAAQRVGFHIGAVAVTVITAAMVAVVAVAYIRRLNPMWILIAPVIGGLAIAASFMIAGRYADHAATTITTDDGPQAAPASAIRKLPVIPM